MKDKVSWKEFLRKEHHMFKSLSSLSYDRKLITLFWITICYSGRYFSLRSCSHLVFHFSMFPVITCWNLYKLIKKLNAESVILSWVWWLILYGDLTMGCNVSVCVCEHVSGVDWCWNQGTQKQTAFPNIVGTIDSVEVRTWTEQEVEVDRIPTSALSPPPPTLLNWDNSPPCGQLFSRPRIRIELPRYSGLLTFDQITSLTFLGLQLTDGGIFQSP